ECRPECSTWCRDPEARRARRSPGTPTCARLPSPARPPPGGGGMGVARGGDECFLLAAGDVKLVSLELGGKSASLIFADADLEQAGASVSSSFGNAGQDCCAGSRILVERPVYDEVVERFVARTRALRIGDPLEDSTEMGSLISREHRERVHGYVRQGVEQGATLCTGGEALRGEAFDR